MFELFSPYALRLNCACSSPEHFLAVLVSPHPTCHLYCMQLHVCRPAVVNNGDVEKELCVDSAVARKTKHYSEVLGACRDAGYKANLLTLEISSRGFIHTDSFDRLYQLFPATQSNRLPWRGRWCAHVCYSPSGSGASVTGKSLPPAMLLLTKPYCRHDPVF